MLQLLQSYKKEKRVEEIEDGYRWEQLFWWISKIFLCQRLM